MTMRDMHGLDCQQCKLRKRFYEDFDNDSKKNVSYFGMISYINQYLVLPVSSEQSKEYSGRRESYKRPDICFLQLINEWTVRDLVEKQFKGLNRVTQHLKERTSYPKPSFYLPQHTGNLIIKKSDSFTVSSPEDTGCAERLKINKDNRKCKAVKKIPSLEKNAFKRPKLGTLKRKRLNRKKLLTDESYEDDLFEKKNFKDVQLDDSNTSVEDKLTTPVWSVHISPRQQSPSPIYQDCYSPTELKKKRKSAEEWSYQRNKRRKCLHKCKKRDSIDRMKQDPETYRTLEKARAKLEKLAKEDCESDQDFYFTDEEDTSN